MARFIYIATSTNFFPVYTCSFLFTLLYILTLFDQHWMSVLCQIPLPTFVIAVKISYLIFFIHHSHSLKSQLWQPLDFTQYHKLFKFVNAKENLILLMLKKLRQIIWFIQWFQFQSLFVAVRELLCYSILFYFMHSTTTLVKVGSNP